MSFLINVVVDKKANNEDQILQQPTKHPKRFSQCTRTV